MHDVWNDRTTEQSHTRPTIYFFLRILLDRRLHLGHLLGGGCEVAVDALDTRLETLVAPGELLVERRVLVRARLLLEHLDLRLQSLWSLLKGVMKGVERIVERRLSTQINSIVHLKCVEN